MSLSALISCYDEDGLIFIPSGTLKSVPASQWIFASDDFLPAWKETLVYLLQLEGEGCARLIENKFLISWPSLFSVLSDKTQQSSIHLLRLPAESEFIPKLSSDGGLADYTFRISIEWLRKDGGRPSQNISRNGAVLTAGTNTYLLTEAAWQLAERIRNFSKLSQVEKTQRRNEHEWGKIRRLSILAGAKLDNFLIRTIILTPEVLNIKMNKIDVGRTKVVEIFPLIEDIPTDKWIRTFDSYSTVQEHYDISTEEGGRVRVILNDSVKSLLKEIKKMPGRRVAGSRAQAFLRNPYAVIGEEFTSVVPPESFEQNREEAGIEFYSFSHKVILGEDGCIKLVELIIQPISNINSHVSEVFTFSTPAKLKNFIEELVNKLRYSKICCVWEGYELELNGDAEGQLAQLKTILDKWENPQLFISYDEIFDLTRYAQRITDIGKYKPVYSPYIAKKKGGDWIPEEIELVFGLIDKNTETYVICSENELLGLISKAEEQGEKYISDPRLPKPLPISEAVEKLQAFQKVSAQINKGFIPEGVEKINNKRSRTKKIVLNYLKNIETKDYEEERSEAIGFNPATHPELPSVLKKCVELKKHQQDGIAHLQHLFKNAPEHVRGCILADDMGLGKTLQLLSFIAWYLEQNKGDKPVNPVLIVAPVSLLDNWQREIDKFFEKDFPKVLLLYGKNIQRLKASKEHIAEQLVHEGLTCFLKRTWREDSQVVLTTYETLRDYEFSLAAEKWGIMICDEAQKIKSPSALVSQAAKKQNAFFKIACTGTPVENSLVDLWNLFDFVQPGFLGSLNDFGKNYRRPIETKTEEEKNLLEKLRNLVMPQIIRRMKEDVADDLPKKNDNPDPVCKNIPISIWQRELYKAAINQFRTKLCQIKNSSVATKETGTAFLALIHYLRAICSAPRPLGLSCDLSMPLHEYIEQSPKMKWLLNILDKIKNKGEKVIIFTEFKEVQRVVSHYINEGFGVRPIIINGDNIPVSRQAAIDKFQDESKGFAVIILSTAAIGFGVNIQAANHVIHFTRPWNPAKEDQATDRAHRIGQTKDVCVYYPTVVAEDFVTFEKRLDELLTTKRLLASDMLNGSEEINLKEFGGISDVTGLKIMSEIPVSEEHLRLLEANAFEIFCQVLWSKQGYDALQTGRSGDGGIDVVAIKGSIGCLIQCKSTCQEKSLGWEAIKDVVAGAAAYKRSHPGVIFKKVSITNACFNDEACRQAAFNEVELYGKKELLELLAQFPVLLSDIQLGL